ncbi:MAG: zinc-binding dehydrogenase [Bacteroidales bacterium]|nr:zinc-binding dehydrogenase [Bacteroidales bacterium]
MKAILIDQPCKSEELKISEIPVPEVRPGWVLVKIQAIGLNHSEALLRMFEIENDYIRKPIVPGIECAGVVADATEESRFSEGDWVIAMMGGMGRSFNGSYAEYALLPEQNVFWVNTTDRTEPWDWISLAAVPETYFTAYGSLTECLLLNDNDTLLVRGATSTVGQAAIQLGKAMGANVIAACRKEKDFGRLKAIGADVCVLDDGHLAESLPSEMRPNKVLELVGPATLQDSLRCVKKPGYVCNTGILGNVFTVEHFDPIKYIPNGVFLTGFFSNFPTQEIIDSMFKLINRKHIKPLYAKVFRLDEIVEAHTLLEKGGAGGKIILKT